MNNSSLNKLGYIPALDGLRAIAVILVMLVHAHFYLGINGQIGVSVFFTLSGFLITTLLLEEFQNKNRVSFIGFYIRRTMRLFPALYSLLTFVVIYIYFFKSTAEQEIIIKEILSAAFYVNNISWSWGWGKKAVLLGHTWSLAVEEQFYLIWPWILFIAAKAKSIIFLQFVLILFIAMSCYFKATNIYPSIIAAIIQESIFIGCLGALLRWNGYLPKMHFILPILSLLIILFIGIFPVHLSFSFFNPCAILSMLVIFGLIQPSEHHYLIKFK